MPTREKIVEAGRKVLSTDAAQRVVTSVVDNVEALATDKVADAGDLVKDKAARAGGRRPARTAKKSPARKSGAKESTAQG